MINITNIVVCTVCIGYRRKEFSQHFKQYIIACYYIAVRFDKNTGNPIASRRGRSCGRAVFHWDISKWLSSRRSAGHDNNIMRLILYGRSADVDGNSVWREATAYFGEDNKGENQTKIKKKTRGRTAALIYVTRLLCSENDESRSYTIV